jgi:hypothetical protein
MHKAEREMMEKERETERRERERERERRERDRMYVCVKEGKRQARNTEFRKE